MSPINYFCFKTDILYIGATSESRDCLFATTIEDLQCNVEQGILGQLRFLACEGQEWVDGCENGRVGDDFLGMFPSLEEFTVTCVDVDFLQFDVSDGRPTGEIEFLSLYDHGSEAEQVVRITKLYDDLVAEGSVSASAPKPKIQRVARGGIMMERKL